MTLQQRIDSLSDIHYFLDDFFNVNYQENEDLGFPKDFYLELEKIIKTASFHNGWFTNENVSHALLQWKNSLTPENLYAWALPYELSDSINPKKVGIIMAGNIPMVGFHDLTSVLLSGHHALVKLSSNDDKLIPFFIKLLCFGTPDFEQKITIIKGKIENFDAVIATGSNNTARYFEYYFNNYPNIIRKNRTSVAVLAGKESEEDLNHLAEDVLRYFGMGCRNVSKLFLPNDFDLNRLFKAFFPYQEMIHVHKYKNNYDYHKAIFLMNQDIITENGFLILKEDKSYHSPISTLFYEYYDDLNAVQKRLETDAEKLQCIVGKNIFKTEIPFGMTQKPALNQYADGVDTLRFLREL